MKERQSHFVVTVVVLLLALIFIWPTVFVARPVGAVQFVIDHTVSGTKAPPPAATSLNGSEALVKRSRKPASSAVYRLAGAYDPSGQYAELGHKIEAIVQKPAYRSAEWGLDIRVVEDDSPVFTHNNDRLFPPASNAKLFTTSAAIDRLGPDFRFQTRVGYEGSLTPDKKLIGDLVIFGQGDPDLGGTLRDTSGQFAVLDSLAQSVLGFGITEIQGDIIGDDSYFSYAPYGEGWMASDLTRDYGAPVSALSFNNNLMTLHVRPGRRVGQPGSAFVYPSESLLTVINKTKTVRRGASAVRWTHQPGTDRLNLTGKVRLRGGGVSHYLLVKDPAFYTAKLFRERLVRAGIKVKGGARARHAGDELAKPPVHLIYIHESLPLLEVVGFTNKKSQNLYAEILLRTLGVQMKGVGSDQAGLEVVYDFLQEAGISRSMARLYDGSGLSRYNLITPRAETMLLAHMASKGYFPQFLDSLSIAGLDGTMRGRMVKGPGFQRVFAKTGSLQNVTTLGGYVRTNSGKMMSFSILVNNHSYSSSTAKRAVDQICNLLAAY